MSTKPDRVTFQNRFNQLVDTLRQEILTSSIPAGDFLPSELTLAEQYELSRKSVRKGIDILVDEGLITKVPRVGNMVNGAEAYQTVTLRLGYYPSMEDEARLSDLCRLFESKYSHIKVETIALPYSGYLDTIKTFLENGWLDAITLNNKDFLSAADYGYLELFEPQARSLEQYAFLPELFTLEDNQYVQPLIFSPVVLCYNKELFRKLELPEPDSSWTWTHLSETAVKIQSAFDLFGFYADVASINRFPIILLQEGFQFTPLDGGYQFDDPLLWDSLLKFRHLIYAQGISPSFLSEADADIEKLFIQQKTAMILTTYFGMKYLKEAPFEYDIAPLPFDTNARTLLLTTGLAVNRLSKHKEAAQLLVHFLISKQAQTHIRQQTLSIPAHRMAAQEDAASAHHPSRFYTYQDIIPTFRSIKDLNISIQALETLHHELKIFWANLEEPAAVTDRLLPSPKVLLPEG